MAMMVERESRPELEVKAVPEEIELPQHLKKGGIEAVETAYKANVQDGGQTSDPVQPVGGSVFATPADPATLSAMSKGSDTNSSTWFAWYWLRAIKKAIHLGLRIVTGSPTNVT